VNDLLRHRRNEAFRDGARFKPQGLGGLPFCSQGIETPAGVEQFWPLGDDWGGRSSGSDRGDIGGAGGCQRRKNCF
jgi:hypothetical protein